MEWSSQGKICSPRRRPPLSICVTDKQARIDSYYLYHDRFLPYIMGYTDLAKANTYAHGLVPG